MPRHIPPPHRRLGPIITRVLVTTRNYRSNRNRTTTATVATTMPRVVAVGVQGLPLVRPFLARVTMGRGNRRYR